MSTYSIPNTANLDGVTTVNEWDLLGVLNLRSATYADQTIGVVQWVEDNHAHYYARPDEEFSIFEAIDEAKNNGKSVVVLDNLS